MTADDTREVFDGRKKSDFFMERDDLVVILAHLITASLNLLRPGNEQAEISRLGELRELSSLRRRQDPCAYALRLEVLRGVLASGFIDRAYELRVAEHILEHVSVFTAHRTVHHGGTCSLGYGSRRPQSQQYC